MQLYTWPPHFNHPRSFDRSLSLPFLDLHAGPEQTISLEGSAGDGSNSHSLAHAAQKDVLDNRDALKHWQAMRRFMRRIGGIDHKRLHLDDERVVSGFCESARNFKDDGCIIAIADIRSVTEAGDEELRGGSLSTSQGGLTAAQLHQELTKDQRNPTTHVGGDRKLIYFSDMDASAMTVVAQTAPRMQRQALIEFFYTHIKPKPSLSATLTVKGFRTFSLSFHLPFFALREHRTVQVDPRTRPSGEPLRRSWALDDVTSASLPTQSGGGLRKCLYEAQAAVVLVGIDDRVWTAYCALDTYFDPFSPASVLSHHDEFKRTGLLWDPVSGRTRQLHDPCWDARTYFLASLDAHLDNALREWDLVTVSMQEAIKRSLSDKRGANIRDFDSWNETTLEHLVNLTSVLSDTVRAWDTFLAGDVGFFTSDDNGWEARLPYLQSLKKGFSCLGDKLCNLNELKTLLEETNRHKIRTRLDYENLQATEQVNSLVKLAVMFSPLMAVMSFFNMQGLPFPVSGKSFILAFLIMAMLWLFAYVMLDRWAKFTTGTSAFANIARAAVESFKTRMSLVPSTEYQKLPIDLEPEDISEPFLDARSIRTMPVAIREEAQGPVGKLKWQDDPSGPGRSEWQCYGHEGEATSPRNSFSTDSSTGSGVSDSSGTLTDEDLEDLFNPEHKAEIVQALVSGYLTKPAGSSRGSSNDKKPPRFSRAVSNRVTKSPVRWTGKIDKGKKKATGDDDDEEDDNNAGRNDPPLGDGDPGDTMLACPYYKAKPITHSGCGSLVLRGIARVKQHLSRCHLIPVHCAVCYEEFPSEVARDEHLRAQNCTKRDRPSWDGITPDQKPRIKRRADPRKSPSENWFDIFDIIFPQHLRPASAYVDILCTNSKEMVSLRGFILTESRSIFDAKVEERIPANLRRQYPEAIEQLWYPVFEAAMATILNQFEKRRQSSLVEPGNNTAGQGHLEGAGVTTGISVQPEITPGPLAEVSYHVDTFSQPSQALPQTFYHGYPLTNAGTYASPGENCHLDLEAQNMASDLTFSPTLDPFDQFYIDNMDFTPHNHPQ